VSEYQRAILGMMIEEPDIWHKAGLIPTHFTDATYRKVYTGMTKLYESGEPVDLVTLNSVLPDVTASDVAELTTNAPSSSRWEYYAAKVKDEARRHWLWRLAGEAKESIENGEATDQVIGDIEDGLVKIALAGRDYVTHIGEGLVEFVNILEERYKRRGEIPGVTTGFDPLDILFGGFEPQKLYYIGARPSKGKSALLLNFVRAGAEAEKRCGLISLESSKEEAYSRLFSNIGNIRNSDIRHGFIGGSLSKLTDAASRVQEWPVWLCDDPQLTVSEVKTVARKMVIAHGVDCLYIDYLQYIRPDVDGLERREHVAATSRALKALARQLHVPVVCAAQLRRDADNHWPHMGDFGESSALEKDADVALLLHSEEDAGYERTWFCIEKNRDGATQHIEVVFDKEHARFSIGPAGA